MRTRSAPSSTSSSVPPSVADRIRSKLRERRAQRFRLLHGAWERGECSIEQVMAALTPEERNYLYLIAEERGLWPDDYDGPERPRRTP